MITATLVGAQSPRLVQIVISLTPDDEEWTLTGAAGEYVWTVPGGMGVGDGAQLTLVDNRSPGNVPVEYTFTSPSIVESATVTVPFSTDFVIQSLDGQRAIEVEFGGMEMVNTLDSGQARFDIPGNPRPVVRYSVTSDVAGSLSFRFPVARTQEVRQLFASGEPLMYRCGAVIDDLLPVGVISYGQVSTVAIAGHGFRQWQFPYALLDDPFMDQRLGAFSWDLFDAAMAGRTWDEFDTIMAGLSWDQFDTLDWSTL